MKQLILALLVISLFTSAAYAQEVSFGSPAVQAVEIKIDDLGAAHVTHIVKDSKNTQQVVALRNDFINLQITNEDGDAVEYGEISGEKLGFLIFPSDDDTIVEYDLKEALTKKDNLWIWDYYYLASTTFYLPEDVDLIFANSNPVLLHDVEGIKCHGCRMILEYEMQAEEKVQQITWQDKTFDIKILATGKTPQIEFDQPNKLIRIGEVEKDQYVTLTIPKELLWNPYEVFLNEKKLLKHEFYQTEELAWINFKANETGTVEIIGISAVPEFPLAAVLVLGIATIVAVRLSGKISLH